LNKDKIKFSITDPGNSLL